MATYLVTGGAGFIGSHLCESLLAQGHHVRVVDDFSTGKRENLPDDVEVITGDIADAPLMREVVKGIDGCYHLAAIASVARSRTQWVATHRTNLTGTITLFEAIARGSERPPVVYASSAAVYGDAAPPIAEDAPRRPLSAYGADKAACEFHAAVASGVHGIPTVGLRFFNVYGPRQDPSSPYSGVISIFCDRLFKGLPIDIHGDGEQTRDFIYVHDVVIALMAAMADPTLAPIYNVCTGTPTSIRHLAEVIDRLVQGYQARACSEVSYLPARAGDIRHSIGDPTLIRETLKLPPPVSLHVGLRPLMDWIKTGRVEQRTLLRLVDTLVGMTTPTASVVELRQIHNDVDVLSRRESDMVLVGNLEPVQTPVCDAKAEPPEIRDLLKTADERSSTPFRYGGWIIILLLIILWAILYGIYRLI